MKNFKDTMLSFGGWEHFCDRGIFYSLCALIFCLPATIALVDIFAGIAILFYILKKKANQKAFTWPDNISKGGIGSKIYFILKTFSQWNKVLGLPIIALVLAVLLSVLLSQYPALSFKAFFGKFLKGVLLYFCVIETLNSQERVLVFLKFFLGAAFIVALSGIVQHFWGVDFLRGHVMAGNRVNASFYDCNGLGAYLIPAIGFVIHFLFAALGQNKQWLLACLMTLLLIILMSCLCWTYSRSSWIGMLSLLVLSVVIDRRKFWCVGGLFLIFIFFFLPSLGQVRHMSLVKDSTHANKMAVSKGRVFSSSFVDILAQGGSGRISFWKKAISIIKISPIWGSGLNTYSKIIMRDPNRKTWWYAHNCYLQWTAETGLLGIGCLLWMFIVFFRQGMWANKHMEDLWLKTALQGCLVGIFGFLVQSFFDNTFFTVQLGVLLWLMIGLGVALSQLGTKLIKSS